LRSVHTRAQDGESSSISLARPYLCPEEVEDLIRGVDELLALVVRKRPIDEPTAETATDSVVALEHAADPEDIVSGMPPVVVPSPTLLGETGRSISKAHLGDVSPSSHF
jgi:hypothetical protein